MHANFPISPAFRSRNWKGERQRQPNAVIAAIILMALLGCLMPQNLTYLCCAWFLCFCRAANADVFNTCKVSPPKVIRGAFAAAESFVSLFQGVQVAFIGQRFEIQIFKLPQNRKVWQVPSKCSMRKLPNWSFDGEILCAMQLIYFRWGIEPGQGWAFFEWLV